MKTSKYNSFLKEYPELPNTFELKENNNLSFIGSTIYGNGFILTPQEAQELIQKDAKNAECIFKYIGGEEVNSHSQQKHYRYVINFGEKSEEEAQQWPDLYQIVKEKVKPERDKLKNNSDGIKRKTNWWLYGRYSGGLYRALAPLDRCLVISCHTKELIFNIINYNKIIFSHALIIFPSQTFTFFAILQSLIHETWAWENSSTMATGLRYSPTDCFRNFPFPKSSKITV